MKEKKRRQFGINFEINLHPIVGADNSFSSEVATKKKKDKNQNNKNMKQREKKIGNLNTKKRKKKKRKGISNQLCRIRPEGGVKRGRSLGYL